MNLCEDCYDFIWSFTPLVTLRKSRPDEPVDLELFTNFERFTPENHGTTLIKWRYFIVTSSTVYFCISGRVLIVAESRVVWIGEESTRYAAGAKIKTLQTRNVLIFAVAAYVYFFPFSSTLLPILAICFQFYVYAWLASDVYFTEWYFQGKSHSVRILPNQCKHCAVKSEPRTGLLHAIQIWAKFVQIYFACTWLKRAPLSTHKSSSTLRDKIEQRRERVQRLQYVISENLPLTPNFERSYSF